MIQATNGRRVSQTKESRVKIHGVGHPGNWAKCAAQRKFFIACGYSKEFSKYHV